MQLCLEHKNIVVSANKSRILTLDLAKGGAETTRDPINPLPRTWLYRILRRRAHHLPPDPNILGPQTQKLENLPFQDVEEIVGNCY